MNWTGGQRKKGVFHNNQLLLDHIPRFKKLEAAANQQDGRSEAAAGSLDNSHNKLKSAKSSSIYSFSLFNQVESFKNLHDKSKKK